MLFAQAADWLGKNNCDSQLKMNTFLSDGKPLKQMSINKHIFIFF